MESSFRQLIIIILAILSSVRLVFFFVLDQPLIDAMMPLAFMMYWMLILSIADSRQSWSAKRELVTILVATAPVVIASFIGVVTEAHTIFLPLFTNSMLLMVLMPIVYKYGLKPNDPDKKN
ncbi:hypothetical protein SAMN05421781_1802 [Marinococcus luteus]|uniref:Uncharacterized protein n=1 Tax=Marinococcus luteus TaxID=1122204 RepID=A0A1H2UPL8_9BACI|nr:hypothetical protein [Marinococcus luteus]SDW57489.1 hypothetical protein SAMN05421781_1802 [Marinococcus luteus]